MATFGDLLRLARNLRGFTQKDAAKRLDIGQAVFSRYENDMLEPDHGFIERCAKAFDVQSEFFSFPDTVFGPPVSVHAMFRGKKSEVSARDVGMITAELNVRLMHLVRFLENVDYRAPNDVPIMDVEEYGSVERIASIVRAHWRVTEGPIKNLTRLMERAGIIVGTSSFHGAPVSGVTFSAPGRPPIVLVNRAHPADRLRFTLAHELGHLVMHRFPTPEMEQEANAFASAFLLPPDEMKRTFRGRKINLELLASLKKEWRVSMQSLLMAATATGALSRHQSQYLWKQISSRGWRLKEPASLDFPFDEPTVLTTMVKAHKEDLGFSDEEMLKLSRVGKSDLIEFYGDTETAQARRPVLRIVN